MKYDEEEVVAIPDCIETNCFICFRYKRCSHVIDLKLAAPRVCEDCVKYLEDKHFRKDWQYEGF